MAYGDIGAAVIQTVGYDLNNGTFACVIKVTDGIIATWNQTSGLDGIVRTRPIAADGTIGAQIDSWIFDSDLYSGGFFVQEISHGIFMSAWRTLAGNALRAATFAIADDGTITHAYVSVTTTALVVPNNVNGICKKPGVNMCAVVWQNAASHGELATFTCNADGTGIALADTWEFEPVRGTNPHISYIQGNIYAITYADGGVGDRHLATVSIADDGTIAEALIDNLVLNASGYWILKIQGNLIALIRTQPVTMDGWIATHTIDIAGNISAEIDSADFEALDLGSAFAASLGYDSGTGLAYVLVYWSESSQDRAKLHSYSVNGAGALVSIDSLNLTLANVVGQVFNAVEAQPDIWVNLYLSSPGSDGFMQTVEIITAPPLPSGPSGTGAAHLRGRVGRRLMLG